MAWITALWSLFVQYWPVLFGAGVPFIAGAIARCSWSKTAKTWAAFVVSIAVGALGAFVSGLHLSPQTLSVFVAGTFGVAQLAYPIMKEKIGTTSKWLDELLAWGGK